MALPLGLLLWGCICFLPQKGHNIAHGFFVNGDDVSRYAGGMLGPQTSNQFHSGEYSNTNQDGVSPRDGMQDMRHQSFVSKPGHHENNGDASSATILSEDTVQRNTESEHVPSSLPMPKFERGSGSQHPFGLLVKEHTLEKTIEGTSFSTIKDFKQFVETMKRSFLMPGSDLDRHFQTARETMEKEIASSAQNINGKHDTGNRSNSSEESTAHHDASEHDAWSEAMNAAFQPNEHDANYQMPSESLFFSDPVDSTTSLSSSGVYDDQDSGPVSALYPPHHSAAKEYVSSNYGFFDSGDISGENPDIFRSSHVLNEDVQSTSYKLPEKIPSSSFFGEDLSFRGHAATSPINSLSQDFSNYSSKTSNITPLISEKNTQETKYVPEVSALMPPSLNSYGSSLYVKAPRGQLYIPDNLLKHRERPAQSSQTHQPTVGKESKDINYTPSKDLPASDSLSSSSGNILPRSSSGHVGVQTSSPHDAQNQAFNRRKPVRFHTVFTVKPSISPHGSSRHDGYLKDQTVSISHPSILPAKDEKSDISKQNLVSAPHRSKQTADNTLIPISSGLDSTPSGLSSQVRVSDVNFNSLTNLAPTSASQKVFSRDDSATRAGLLQTFIEPTKVWRRPASVNKKPGNMIYQLLKLLSASRGSPFWRNVGNTKRLPPQTGPNMSSPSVNAYVAKSRNRYTRGKVSLSKTVYAPYQLDEYENTVSHVKGFEEQ